MSVHQVVIFPKHHKSQAGSGSEKEQRRCPPSAASCLFSPLCWPRHLWWAGLGNWAGVGLTWQRNVFVIARGRRRRPEQGPGCCREAELRLLAAPPACSALCQGAALALWNLGDFGFQDDSFELSNTGDGDFNRLFKKKRWYWEGSSQHIDKRSSPLPCLRHWHWLNEEFQFPLWSWESFLNWVFKAPSNNNVSKIFYVNNNLRYTGSSFLHVYQCIGFIIKSNEILLLSE